MESTISVSLEKTSKATKLILLRDSITMYSGHNVLGKGAKMLHTANPILRRFFNPKYSCI